MNWIETSERMPADKKEVLFLYSDTEGTEYLTGWYDKENDEWVSNVISFFRDISEKAYEDSHFTKSNVKFWMKLPQRPNKMSSRRKIKFGDS